MTIEALVKAIPPPAKPYEAFVGPWAPVEATIGTRLPHDYKDFVRRYGNGYFMQFIGICVPLAENPIYRLENGPTFLRRKFNEEDYPDLPYTLWPSPGGLLPVGATDNGDYLFWLPVGLPHSWRVVVWGSASGGFEVFECNLTSFLTGLATGTIRPRTFPELLTCVHPFVPTNPNVF